MRSRRSFCSGQFWVPFSRWELWRRFYIFHSNFLSNKKSMLFSKTSSAPFLMRRKSLKSAFIVEISSICHSRQSLYCAFCYQTLMAGNICIRRSFIVSTNFYCYFTSIFSECITNKCIMHNRL